MRLLFKLAGSIFLCNCFCWSVAADDIVVFKTRSIPIVEDILNGFQSGCTDQHSLIIYDMQGKLHQGTDIIEHIKTDISKGNIKAVFTIGLPATTLATDAITKTSIVYTMVNNPELRGLNGDNIRGIAQDLSAQTQVQTIAKILPKLRQLAIIYSHENSSHKIDKFTQAAIQSKIKLNRYQIASVKDLPKTLRQVIMENDALLLLPDKVVINQASLEYFVTTVLENGFPTISYNKYLVKAGLLMGLAPDYLAMGEQAGELLCKDQQRSSAIIAPRDFNIVINAKTAKTIRTNLATDLINWADYVY